MKRIDENRVLIETPQIDIILFANEQVFIDRASVDEAIDLARVLDTVDKLKAVGFLSQHAGIDKIILTPDFHKGAGVPIGTVMSCFGLVLPSMVGSDIGCGMRFITTDVKRAEFESLGEELDRIIRYIFFEGGRNIPLSRQQRTAIFTDGLPGLCISEHSHEGIWEYWDDRQQANDIDNIHMNGRVSAADIFQLEDFIKGSGGAFTRDDQIGSIGGGNHFCEIQAIGQIYDRHKAHEWGIESGMMALMVHSGSVGIGHQVGNHFADRARDLYPAGLKHEQYYMLPDRHEHVDNYLSAMANAANFAFANRLFLGLMLIRALSEALGRKIATQVVYDAPHNMVWEPHDDDSFLHRKGACPADEDQPVIIPGSMGSSSFILSGLGNQDSLCSACHGAGRAKPRQQGRRSAEEFTCRVVTKIDPRRVRHDIRDDYMKSLMEEAPDKYKEIGPIIQTVEGAGIARRVAQTFPLLTVKGL